MASWEQVGEIALALPQTGERLSRGRRQWRVKDKLFVWERPLRPREVEALGAAPGGPIVAARVEHLGAKQALLESEPEVYFTTPHFDGYPAILARLELLGDEDVHELVTEAWLVRAPVRLAEQYLKQRGA